MDKCDKCKNMIKEEDINKCPTCGYVYCPECVKRIVKNKEEDKCIVCEAVLEFFDIKPKNDNSNKY